MHAGKKNALQTFLDGKNRDSVCEVSYSKLAGFSIEKNGCHCCFGHVLLSIVSMRCGAAFCILLSRHARGQTLNSWLEVVILSHNVSCIEAGLFVHSFVGSLQLCCHRQGDSPSERACPSFKISCCRRLFLVSLLHGCN